MYFLQLKNAKKLYIYFYNYTLNWLLLYIYTRINIFCIFASCKKNAKIYFSLYIHLFKIHRLSHFWSNLEIIY